MGYRLLDDDMRREQNGGHGIYYIVICLEFGILREAQGAADSDVFSNVLILVRHEIFQPGIRAGKR